MLDTSPVFDELYAAESRRAEYRCVPVPGLSSANNPNVTINQVDISGDNGREPILTQGYGDVQTLILGNIFVGSLSFRIRNTRFPTIPYRKNDCFQFEMRFTSTENPPETVSEWLPLARFIVSKADIDKTGNAYNIEAKDACSIFEMFEVDKALGTVPEMTLPTTYKGMWERLDTMLAEYCRLNGLWRVTMPEIPIEGISPIKSIQGLSTRDILVYMVLAWAGNVRADYKGDIKTEYTRDMAAEPPKQDVYWKEFIPGEQALPFGVARMSGGRSKERIYPDGARIPTPADGISLFDYHSPWYTGSNTHTQRVFNRVVGYANKPFEAATCFPHPAIEPGDVVTLDGGDYLVLHQQMKCGADPVFTLACGSLSKERYRGTTAGRLESALSGGFGESENHIILDRLPTAEEIDEMQTNSVVHIYDPKAEEPPSGQTGILYPVVQTFVKKEKPIEPIDTDFSITVNSGADASFILPTSGQGNIEHSYDWIVDWGDGTTSEHRGTVNYHGAGIMHNYPQSNTLYKIKINPRSQNELGWLRSFGFSANATNKTGSNAASNKAKVMIVDGQLTEQMVSASEIENSILTRTFSECTNITMGQSFNLPQNITSVGDSFCTRTFDGCTSLMMNNVLQIPQGITSTGNAFCAGTFAGCTSLTTGVIRFFGSFAMTQFDLNLSSVYYQTFYNCSALTETLSDIPQLQMNPNSRRYTFQGCPPDIIAPLHVNWK